MIRRFVFASVSAIALTGAAYAADIYPTPAPPPVFVPPAVWTGFYFGGNGGYGWNDTPVTDRYFGTTSATISDTGAVRFLSPQGGFGGGQIGYNWQGFWSPQVVLGIEADIEGSGIGDHGFATATIPTKPVGQRIFGATDDINWFGTVRGRIGYAFGPALVYATGGFAYGGVELKGSYRDSNGYVGAVRRNETETGYAVGGGVEYKLAPNWTLKVEYQFIDLGSISAVGPLIPPTGGVVGYNLRATEDERFSTVRVGVNYLVTPIYQPLK